MMAMSDPQNQWFVLRGEDKYGPFEYASVIRMLQNNELFDYNYVWAPHLENWTLLGELPDFSRDRLARLIENSADLRKAFIQRGATRKDLVVPVYGHNEHLFFDGQSLSLSENGALLLLNTPLLLPGQPLLLHFRRNEICRTAFNVTATVVRKNFTRTRINVKSGLHYAVRFNEISETGQQELKQMIMVDMKEAK